MRSCPKTKFCDPQSRAASKIACRRCSRLSGVEPRSGLVTTCEPPIACRKERGCRDAGAKILALGLAPITVGRDVQAGRFMVGRQGKELLGRAHETSKVLSTRDADVHQGLAAQCCPASSAPPAADPSRSKERKPPLAGKNSELSQPLCCDQRSKLISL